MTQSTGNSIDATFYVQIEPEFSPTSMLGSGEPRVWGAKAARITQGRPTKPVPNTVLVKLTIRMPKAAFLPLRPEAVIEIPASFTQVSPPLVVTAEDANEGADDGE